MTEEHPNIALMKRLDPADLTACADLFAPDVVFHYFNPNLPDVEGDYVGLDGIQKFFKIIGAMSKGTFRVQPVATTAVGDELVVVQTRNTLTLEEVPITIDVVVVWRILDGRIVEVWDIPSAYTQVADVTG